MNEEKTGKFLRKVEHIRDHMTYSLKLRFSLVQVNVLDSNDGHALFVSCYIEYSWDTSQLTLIDK